MSTKIYDAYYTPTHRLQEKLYLSRLIAVTEYLQDSHALKYLEAIGKALLPTFTAIERPPFLDLICGDACNLSYVYYIEQLCEMLAFGSTKFGGDPNFSCTVFVDGNDTYLKFYPNSLWMQRALKKIVDVNDLIDFHYQNQTDPPPDVSEEEYEKRKKTWDRLCPQTFYDGMVYPLMDGHILSKVIEENEFFSLDKRFTYAHLSYVPEALRSTHPF